MRLFRLLPVVVIAGCTTQDVAQPTGRAMFQSYPDALFEAFESACGGPAQTFNRPNPDVVECREYLPPEATAALILSFDGTTEDLPELVIRFQAQAADAGYLVENDVFVSVPQKDGRRVQVRREDHKLMRTLDKLYERAGGVPSPS
ncbi:MAG: hypothetical protein AB3N23_07365 [Paracoccaceae bacterium]